ncbi:PKD domain-containing protein, partial [Urechidicola sp. KH5]
QSATPTDLTVVASGGIGTFSYQWYSNTTNTNTGGTLIPGATSDSYTPPTSTVGTLYYYVVISQSPGSLDCEVVSNTAAVITTTAPIINTQPQSSQVCENESATILQVDYLNGTGTPSYQWFSNNTNSTIGAVAIGGANTSSYDPPTSTLGITYYYCEITFTGGGCPSVLSDFASVDVNQTPDVPNYNDDICSGLTYNLDFTTIPGAIIPAGTTFSWSAPSIVPAGSVTGTTDGVAETSLSQTLTNTTNLPATVTYTITPTAGICIGNDFDVTITVNPGISVIADISNSACFGSDNAGIDITISGGTPISPGNPFNILWTGPNGFSATTEDISNLEPGTYNLNIQDGTSCVFNQDYVITEPTLLTIQEDNLNHISCFGANDGSIEITFLGGTPNYTYAWTTTNGSGLIPTQEDQSGLGPGNYTLTLTDANNCVTTQDFEIIEPIELLISETHNQLLCFGDNNGFILVNVDQLSIAPFTYALTGTDYLGNAVSASFTTTNPSYQFDNLVAGIYQIVVTDVNGCFKEIGSINITQPDGITISYTKVDETCYGAMDGAITLNVSGGTGSFTYDWSDFGSGPIRTNLSAGIYTVIVTDESGCSQSESIEITSPEFHIEPVVSNISCFGANDGFIHLNIIGGVLPITVTWADDPTAGAERNNLPAGTYSVYITDSDSPSCPIDRTFTITEPAALNLSGNVTNALDCDIVESGAINLLVTGGTLPMEINWSNGATTEDLDNIPPGDYTVLVTDANGCEETRTFNVFRPDALELDVETTVFADCDLRQTLQRNELIINGGVPPFNIVWSRGDIDPNTPTVMTTNESGVVLVDVTDSLGCMQQFVFDVDLQDIGFPDFEFTSFGFETYGTFSIDDPIFFTNTSTGDPISIQWNFGDQSQPSDVFSPEHIYNNVGRYAVTLTVQYDYDCTYSVTKQIEITQGYDIILPTAFTPNQDGINDTMRPSFFGLQEMEMSVFDTWGEKIYYENSLSLEGWDGSIKGEDAENGNYVIAVKAVTFYGKEITLNAPITLLR